MTETVAPYKANKQSMPLARDIYGDHIPRDIDEWFADLAIDVWDVQKRMWKISHKLAWGEATYKDKIYQYLDRLPFSAGYLANLKTLGGNFSPSRRRELEEKGFPEFPLSYYQELCSLTPKEQEMIMQAIVADNLKRADIRKLKRQMGVQTPRDAWELACENDALGAENGRQRQELETLRARIAADAADECQDNASDVVDRAYWRDTDEDLPAQLVADLWHAAGLVEAYEPELAERLRQYAREAEAIWEL